MKVLKKGIACTFLCIGAALSGCNGGQSHSIAPTPTSTPTSTPTTQPASTITFSAIPKLNNPTSSDGSNAAQTISFAMTALNSKGQVITPSSANPININIYGAPNGVISPTAITSTNGQVTIQYNGKWFPNNITLNAWIKDTTNNGAAIGVTQLLQQNLPSACNYGTTSYQIPLNSELPHALNVSADVGYSSASAAAGALKDFTLDTGSLGVIVPVTELGPDAIGPGAQGSKSYDSSGKTFSGNYYLASLSLKQKDGSIVQTQPILVLAVKGSDLRYLGVGFNRNSTESNDLFNSPADNAFLHLTDASNGTDITPGYVLTPGDSSGFSGLTLGITADTTDYALVNLTPNSSIPGDFNAQKACYTIVLSGGEPSQFCGTGLLDIGISEMFIDLPRAQWPHGTYDSAGKVPITGPGVPITMMINMGESPEFAMSYRYTVESPPKTDSPAPTYVEWIDTTDNGMIFVNTGRRALYAYDYMYNGQCGQVGFKSIKK